MGIWSVSPLDGRYAGKLGNLGKIVGEGGLIGYRIRVEAAWLLFLEDQAGIDLRMGPAVRSLLESLKESVPEQYVTRVKEIEATTNHDVKAVEYLLREILKEQGASPVVLAHIHFACTSEDINNTAYALMLDHLRNSILLPAMEKIIDQLRSMADSYADLPMMSRTHGQTASPTTLGKEIAVFGHRLARQANQFTKVRLEAKFSGAVGNYNAHQSAYPDLDWPRLSQAFLENELGLIQNPLTTQIENHDTVIEYCDAIRRFNGILLGLCRDMWGYISLNYFRQQIKEGEVGSSTMPHKVNPIDFENAEGNLGLANALATHFGDKLIISRWQRDLSDSTVLRSLGTLAGYSQIAYQSCLKGLGKVVARPEVITRDLASAVEVLAEPIQTVMRRFAVVDAYERLKEATRGQAVTQEVLTALIENCDELPAEWKKALKALKPETYTGAAGLLARSFVGGK